MKLNLTLACAPYDRTAALADGSIAPEGITLNFLPMEHGELFRRQARYAEFDVSEFSLSTYTMLLNRGDRRLVAIPVFPSRKFRHGDIFVNAHAGIREPRDLVGKRMGAMEYQQTAAVWQRAVLEHDYGVRPDQMEWYFGSFYGPAPFSERIPFELPPGVRSRTIASEQSLDQMLDAGEIDALMGANLPPSFQRGSPNVARLFPNYEQVEQAYFRRTGLFPIMHTIVVKREIYEQHPWVAVSLFEAFVRAKAAARRLLARHGAVYCMLPWLTEHVTACHELMGEDPFVYGLQANRPLLENFLQYNQEQGLLSRAFTVDELFAIETRDAVDHPA
jgi:4,5-dihydroxyphthalate decarboxylase